MGNIDSRARFEGGYLYVKTDRPYYYPGNVVYGKIYIRLEVPMNAKHLELKIKGKEKASFLYRETIKEGERTRTVTRKAKMSKKILEFNGICFQFTQLLLPGDYTIPFEFTLPTNLPSSIMYHNKGHSDHPKAHVKYSARATIVTHEKKVLKYKQMLIIQEPPVAF